MDIWVIAALSVILVCIAYSAWKQVNFSILASIACVAVFAMAVVAFESGDEGIGDELGYMSHDIIDPSRIYTILTSMFMHADITHIFFNLLVLILIGMIFEQRIGTRAMIVLYLLTGLAGTLSFSAVHWSNPFVPVVGASGAIMGILGAFARLFPNEKMMFMFIPIPLSIWTVVLIVVALQFVFFFRDTSVAVEAHLGGLLAGILLAPYVVRLIRRQNIGTRRVVVLSADKLRSLATTPQLRSMLERIEHEEVPDVRNAWIEHFLSRARCPHCGSRLRLEKDSIRCEKGHLV